MVTAVRPATVSQALPSPAGAPRTGRCLGTAPAGRSDASILRRLQALGRKPDPRQAAVTEEVAALLASELFFLPLLTELRQFPLGRELARGGLTETTFGQQLDQRIADQVAVSSPELVRRVVGLWSASDESASSKIHSGKREGDDRFRVYDFRLAADASRATARNSELGTPGPQVTPETAA